MSCKSQHRWQQNSRHARPAAPSHLFSKVGQPGNEREKAHIKDILELYQAMLFRDNYTAKLSLDSSGTNIHDRLFLLDCIFCAAFFEVQERGAVYALDVVRSACHSAFLHTAAILSVWGLREGAKDHSANSTKKQGWMRRLQSNCYGMCQEQVK